MEKWKLKFASRGIIMPYQMVSKKEKVINKRVPLSCCCCKKVIPLGKAHFIYWIRPKNKNEISSFGDNVCLDCNNEMEK